MGPMSRTIRPSFPAPAGLVMGAGADESMRRAPDGDTANTGDDHGIGAALRLRTPAPFDDALSFPAGQLRFAIGMHGQTSETPRKGPRARRRARIGRGARKMLECLEREQADGNA